MANLYFPLLLLLLLHFTDPSLQHMMSSIDLAALSSIRNSLRDFPGSNFFSTWDFNAPNPCSSFSGVVCSSLNRVVILTLGTGLSNSPGLAGSLSPSIAELTELTQLILSPGIVGGTIPNQLSQLRNLRVISLTNNRLAGSIPASISSLANLHTLDLSFNRLTGSIPPGIFTELTQMKVLVLASNRLTGVLPGVVWSQLFHLDLRGNKLTGSLPWKLPSTIRYLSLSRNKMWGPLDGLVSPSLTELVYLDLSMNKFSGPIPTSLFNTRLSSMFLQRNNLSGWLPQYPTVPYGEGSIVDLSHNFLTGELSGVLAGAETLFLNNNRLMGTVPVEYVDNVFNGVIKTFYLQHNYIREFVFEQGRRLPDTTTLCMSYNCMLPPVELMTCPASSGGQISRPASQCLHVKTRRQ